jgi:hypothetical protein
MPQDNSIGYQQQILRLENESTSTDVINTKDQGANVKRHNRNTASTSNSNHHTNTNKRHPSPSPDATSVVGELHPYQEVPTLLEQALLLHPLEIPRFVCQHGPSLTFPQIVRSLLSAPNVEI